MLLCSANRVEVFCFVGCQVVCVTALVYNVPIPAPLLPARLLCLDFAADAVTEAKGARI